ncbi:ArsR/SmtB family transcription factor [Falsibacillus albus]|uniref:ArsR family transcriptional regulator n=1 Tax=Falsibacillus albus TaxID=2478915 RepID=A0A3L7K0I1_9BACI|nr:metalloregulator ArsR/SmtB family transcription factor [Falsibacillus albus]RLQ96563.1 ArsR family transcriptional regulator [Falsibacillus albus]
MGKEAIDTFRACIPLFQTLSDPYRQDIILLLAEKEPLTVNEITEHLTLSRPAVSHHLKIMRDQKIVSIEQKGTQRHYSLELEDALALLKQLVSTVEENCY